MEHFSACANTDAQGLEGAAHCGSLPTRKVANTWADHFQLTGQRREAFIAHYLQRCLENRYWCVTHRYQDGHRALARFENHVMFFDGRIIQVAQAPRLASGTATALQRFLLALPSPRPPATAVTRLIAEAAQAFRRHNPLMCMADHTFAALTSFCGAAHELATTSTGMDAKIGRQLYDESEDCRFINPRRSFYLRCIGSTLKAFCAALNPSILHTVRSVRCPSAGLYNWIADGDTLRRTQAIQAYPILLPAHLLEQQRRIANRDSGATNARQALRQLSEAVDRGESIADLLAHRFGYAFYPASASWSNASAPPLPRSVLRAAARVSPSVGGSALRYIQRCNGHPLCGQLLAGARLGNRAPTTRAEWKTWFALSEELTRSWDASYSGRHPASFFAGLPPWDSPAWTELLAHVRNLQDLHRFIGELYIQRPDLTDNNPKIRERLRAMTLKQLLKLSADWHAQEQEARIAIARDNSKTEQGWPALLEHPYTHPDTGIELVELLSPAALEEEGSQQRHCVGGYAFYCYEGISRIVSLRRDGQTLATAELQLQHRPTKQAPPRLTCSQLYGEHNTPIAPKSDARRALQWLLKSIPRTISANLSWPVVPYHLRSDSNAHEKAILDTLARWMIQRMG